MDRYELTNELLGDGSFGRVMKATLKESGDVVAIKQIKQKFKTWKASVNLREIQCLRNLSHPNIVPIREVIREGDDNLYFVFEYMSDGSLYDLTKSCIEEKKGGRSEKLSNALVCSYVKQILSGLSYIHSQGFVHRDIKPENILVNGNECKVADFGLAREITSGRRGPLTYYVSTRWYRAPEVILKCHSYGKAVDLYATGLILAELHSLRPLFPGSSEIDQVNKIVQLLGLPTEETWEEGVKKMKRMNFRLVNSSTDENPQDGVGETERVESAIRNALPRDTSPVVARLVQILIAWNPMARPTAEDALQHEYFQSSDTTTTNVTIGGSNGGLGSRNNMSRQNDGRVVEQHFHPSKPTTREDTTVHQLAPSPQPENEFDSYLAAFSNAHNAEPVNARRSSKPFGFGKGNKIRPIFPKESESSEPTSTRRRQIERGTKRCFNDVTSARKSTKKPRSSRYNHGRAVEKPRWLLSNQNLGKRALSVHVGLPIPGTESFVGGNSENIINQHSKSNLSDDENPFRCLD